MRASPFAQETYQVRLDWGVEGLARLAAADVVVVVDVLRFSTTVTDAVARGETFALDDRARRVSINGALVAERAAESGATVLLGCLRNPSAVGDAVLALQSRNGARTSVAVIACGERTSRHPDASVRFAVEDQMGAGAVVDALAVRGIDHTSPEAAVAGEAFRALHGATRHLLSACAGGRELAARGMADDVLNAAVVDGSDAVPVLRDGVFTEFA